MAYVSFDPYLQKQICSRDYDSPELIRDKVTGTHNAWIRWKKSAPGERKVLLENLASLLDIEKERHASLIVAEMGKPVTQAVAEVEKCALVVRHYAANLSEFMKIKYLSSGARRSYVRYDPQGIVFGIMPWNFPYWQVFRFLAPALAGGNAVVLKHASNVSLCAEAIEDVVIRAGFPDGLLTILFPAHDQMESIIAMPGIRAVTLTGSTVAGSVIASLAGRYIKKCVLELGGSDPFIVFADADIGAASEAAVTARFQNCGQSCIAAKRFLVHESVYEEFVDGFLANVSRMKAGDPRDPSVYLGPMVSIAAVNEIDRQVRLSLEMGAGLLCGGHPGSEGPAFYEATLIEKIPPGSPADKEELFGPVASLSGFANTEDAVNEACRSRFGLGSSVWTRNMHLAEKVAAALDTGAVAVNGFMRSDPSLPFGGVKESGFGRELAGEGFNEFLNIKSVAFY